MLDAVEFARGVAANGHHPQAKKRWPYAILRYDTVDDETRKQELKESYQIAVEACEMWQKLEMESIK